MERSLFVLVFVGLVLSCDLSGTRGSSQTPKDNSVVRTPSGLPTAVYFDATETTSAATTRPFHELEYRWNFGDTYADASAARWDAGVNASISDRNRATGPLAAHVYETKGSYTATLQIVENGIVTVTKTYPVVVDDPEVVFASTTTCVSSDGDFTGAPAGARKVTSSDFDEALDGALHPAAGTGAKRILFKRGHTFGVSKTTWVDVAGPVVIGAFGNAPAPPLLKAEVSANPGIGAWGTATCNAVGVGYGGTKVRVMDLEIDGNGVTTSPMRAVQANGREFLMLRVYGHDLGYLATLGGDMAHQGQSDYQAVVDCRVAGIVDADGNMPLYLQDAFHVYVAGNDIDSRGGGEYSLRYQGGRFGVISHNTFNACGDAKSMLTIRGDQSRNPSAGYVVGSGAGYVAGRHVVSDNLFNGLTCTQISTLVSIVPQNGGRDEEIADIVVERNIFTASPGQMTHLLITASDVTVRNNLFDATGAGVGPMLAVSYRYNTVNLRVPSRNQIFNNSFFSNTSGGVTAVRIYNEGRLPQDTTVKNNFLFAPQTGKSGEGNGGPLTVLDNGENSIVSHNTANYSTATPLVRTAPKPFSVVPPSANPADWKLSPGSYGLGAGVSVPVWSDFLGTELQAASTRNLGALAL